MSLQTMWQRLQDATIWQRLGLRPEPDATPETLHPVSYPTSTQNGHIRVGTGYRPAAADLGIPKPPGPDLTAADVRHGPPV